MEETVIKPKAVNLFEYLELLTNDYSKDVEKLILDEIDATPTGHRSICRRLEANKMSCDIMCGMFEGFIKERAVKRYQLTGNEKETSLFSGEVDGSEATDLDELINSLAEEKFFLEEYDAKKEVTMFKEYVAKIKLSEKNN